MHIRDILSRLRGEPCRLAARLGLLAVGAQVGFTAACVWCGASGRLLPNRVPAILLGIAFFASVIGLVLAGLADARGERQGRERESAIIMCSIGLLLCIYPVGLSYVPA
jgi:hypothetical protein